MSRTNRSKQDEARAYAKSLSDDDLRGFAYDQERLDAKVIAGIYQLGHVKEAAAALAAVLELGADWRQVLRFVLVELEGKRTRSDFSTNSLNIIRAYIAACAFDSAPITPHKVKTEYVRLFTKERRPRNKTIRAWLRDLDKCNKIPDHKTFRETLERYGAAIRKDRRGRPRK